MNPVSVSSRALVTAALVAACALHVSVTGQVLVPAMALLVAVAATLAGPRLDLAQAAQALTLIATAALTFGAALLLDAPLSTAEGGPKLQYVVASGAAVLTVAARLWMRKPERGDPATWALGLVVFYSCGRVASPLYLPLAVSYLGLAWLHTAHRSGVASHRSRRHLVGALALLVASAVLASGTAAGLRVAYAKTSAYLSAHATSGDVGFGAGAFALGSMDGLRDSDEVILRVHGPAPERFRGQVYTDYQRGTWLPPDGRLEPVPRGPQPTGVVTTLEFVSTDQQRLFLPADSAAVVVRPPGLLRDALGVPRPVKGAPAAVRIDTTGPVRLPEADPSEADLAIPPEVATAIGPLLQSWMATANSPRARVAAIQTQLEQHYTYSLHYDRHPDQDPVVEFLLDSRLGHCEYFASAMALSARFAGVPARVVTGFRSTETSPFGGHRIVRSRDAHAWVEVYLDGSWEEVDPSPQKSAEAGPSRAFLAGALDDLAVLWQRYGLQALVAVLLAVFVGLQIRSLLADRRAPEVARHEAWQEGPPTWLLPLLDQLAQADLARGSAESIEAFAERAGAAGQAGASELLRRYAAWRYGGLGEVAGLAQEVEVWCLTETS